MLPQPLDSSPTTGIKGIGKYLVWGVEIFAKISEKRIYETLSINIKYNTLLLCSQFPALKGIGIRSCHCSTNSFFRTKLKTEVYI